MLKYQVCSLNPDLVIGIEAAIDLMGASASCAAELRKPHYLKEIQQVRREARALCPAYRNCRVEDWCWSCASGQGTTPLFLGDLCLGCKLLVVDSPVRARESKLVQVTVQALPEQSVSVESD